MLTLLLQSFHFSVYKTRFLVFYKSSWEIFAWIKLDSHELDYLFNTIYNKKKKKRLERSTVAGSAGTSPWIVAAFAGGRGCRQEMSLPLPLVNADNAASARLHVLLPLGRQVAATICELQNHHHRLSATILESPLSPAESSRSSIHLSRGRGPRSHLPSPTDCQLLLPPDNTRLSPSVMHLP